MKTKKMLARLLGEVMEQRDNALSELRAAMITLESVDARQGIATGEIVRLNRDYPLRVLRDAHGGNWTWAAENVARRVHDDMGEDQVELRAGKDCWQAVWYYHPCKARRASGAKVKELNKSYLKPTAGEALLDLIRLGIPTVEGDDESA